MLFNSVHFVFFFVILTLLHFAWPHSRRWLLLLAASCYFYMAFIPAYILILAFTIVVDYFAGILIEQAVGRRRTLWLTMSIVANVGMLAVFKYFNFLNDLFRDVATFLHVDYSVTDLSILLPLGLSFHTFQAMSYTIEVYRGNQPAERHFGIYALYVLFWPQLVAGPIERPQNLLPQFRTSHSFDFGRVEEGLKLMLWGFFKKLVIADRAAVLVNQVYDDPQQFAGLPIWLGTYAFAFQIYCDFSGYSDIARGGAKVFGYDLMVNFDRPYLAASIQDFWRRWHISLSTWFRDYLYLPLGGNRISLARTLFNLMIVFVISGVWHGANWTFVIWGGLHGALMAIYLLTDRWRHRIVTRLGTRPVLRRLWSLSGILLTFHLVLVGWVFFRAKSVSDALSVLGRSFTFDRHDVSVLRSLDFSLFELTILVGSVVFMLVIEIVQPKKRFEHLWIGRAGWVRWGFAYALLGGIWLFGKFGGQGFIYFQF